MDNRTTIDTLSRLVQIVDAGERGYATAAVSIRHPGLKVLFKSYAQQRARLQEELQSEIERLGGDFEPRTSLRGTIHRGRLAILATMTIEDERREQGVIKEALIGERYALRAYQQALAGDLPEPTRLLLERQRAEIAEVVEQVELLREQDGYRMYVQLCDSETSVESAIQMLKSTGLHEAEIDRFFFFDEVERYDGKSVTAYETVLSGAVGAALWGGLSGALMAFAAVSPLRLEVIRGAGLLINWLAFLGIILAGSAFLGASLGLVIGASIAEEDTYDYEQHVAQGHTVIATRVDKARAPEVVRILEGNCA